MEFEGKKFDYSEGLSLRDSVYLAIREAILNGEFPPNKRLREIPLSQKLGVSRTPVREAIRKLEEEHLVVIMPKCGARVASFTNKDVTDALDVRLTIEDMAVRLAARNMTDEQIAELKAINKEMESAIKVKDVSKISEADNRLHNRICIGADNRVLLKIMYMLEEQVLRYRVEYIKSVKDYKELIDEHNELIKALEAGDESGAAKIMDLHIMKQKEKICEIIQKQSE